MRELRGKTVLITGAASGIGRASARLFVEAGAKLIVCDVNEIGLRDLEKELTAREALLLAARVDVSDRDEMQAFAAQVHALVPAVDVLLNNAGVGLAGGILNTSLDDWEWVLNINLWGAIHGCHFFVPKMVERGAGGAVINVASVLGLHAAPNTIGYSTSKFGVVGLSEALGGELAPHRIDVTAICPGMIDTSIIANGRMRSSDPEKMKAKTMKLFAKRGHPPELVARAIVAAARSGSGVTPVAPEAWGIWMMQRFAPALLPRFERALKKRGLIE